MLIPHMSNHPHHFSDSQIPIKTSFHVNSARFWSPRSKQVATQPDPLTIPHPAVSNTKHCFIRGM